MIVISLNFHVAQSRSINYYYYLLTRKLNIDYKGKDN